MKSSFFAQRELPRFLAQNAKEILERIEELREVGFLARGKDPRIVRGFEAASADGLHAMMSPGGSVRAAVVENKCVAGEESLRNARDLLCALGPVNCASVEIIEGKAVGEWDSELKKTIQNQSHRAQRLRHAQEVGVDRVLHAVSAKNRILRIVDLTFTDRVRNLHLQIPRSIRSEHAFWAFNAPHERPNLSSAELGYAGSNSDFKAAMKFLHDLAKRVAKNGAFLDERYTRPTIVAAWSAGLKNWTDICSQYLPQFSFCN